MLRTGRASFARRFPPPGLGGGVRGYPLSLGLTSFSAARAQGRAGGEPPALAWPISFSAARERDNRYAILFARLVRLYFGRQGESTQRSGAGHADVFRAVCFPGAPWPVSPLFWDTTFGRRGGGDGMAFRSLVPFGKRKWRPQTRPPRDGGGGLRRWRRRSGRRCTCSNPCCGACRRRPRRR